MASGRTDRALRQDLGLSRLPTRSVAGRAPLGHSNPKPTRGAVPRPRKGVSVCPWQTGCEPTEPAGERLTPLDRAIFLPLGAEVIIECAVSGNSKQ